jgi:hypothetical protein
MAKKTRQLNDTIALQMMPIDPVQKNESNHMSVRKIDNGYITCRSSNKDGQYESSEMFTPEPPIDSGDRGGNPMAKAAAYLNRTGTT